MKTSCRKLRVFSEGEGYGVAEDSSKVIFFGEASLRLATEGVAGGLAVPRLDLGVWSRACTRKVEGKQAQACIERKLFPPIFSIQQNSIQHNSAKTLPQ